MGFEKPKGVLESLKMHSTSVYLSLCIFKTLGRRLIRLMNEVPTSPVQMRSRQQIRAVSLLSPMTRS